MTFTLDELSSFISRATASTYAGGGAYEKIPERVGFAELVFADGDWAYRDSYTGFYRSSGMEIVRYQDQIVWTSNYGGGMVTGQEILAGQAFDILKKAMLVKPADYQSFRGPKAFVVGPWKYTYTQEGDLRAFHGYEEIHYQHNLVFSHRIHGGIILDKADN